MKFRIQNISGFTLTEALIAVAVMGILTMAMVSLFESLSKESKAISQKVDAAELRNGLVLAMTKGDTCSWQVKDQILNLADATPTTPSAASVNLPAVYAGLNSSSYVLARMNTDLMPLGSGLKVSNITLSQVYSLGVPNEYTGTLSVQFTPESMIRSLRPASAQVTFATEPADPLTAKRITECAKSTYARAFSVPTSELKNYHISLNLDCSNMNTGKMFWDSACSRYCSGGCTAGQMSCAGTFPGKNYISGLANECNDLLATAQCFCFK